MKSLRRVILALSLLALLPVTQLWADSAAMNQLRTTVDAVIEVLRQKDVPVDSRRQQLSKLVRTRFNFGTMARSSLGPNWSKLDAGQQQRFVQLFTELLEATYTGRIDEYRDETVRYVAEQERQGRINIDTEILSGGKTIPISYRLAAYGDQWLVYDVVIEGSSLIRNYRTTYGDVFGREGFDGLAAKMEQRIAELRSSKQGA